MALKSTSIPVNSIAAQVGAGIFVGRISSEDVHLYEQFEEFDIIKRSHRDAYHLFFLQEKGTTTLEIDFQKHAVRPSSVMFIHQNQVHRTLSFKNATVSVWAVTNENISAEYLKLLEDIAPAKPLALTQEAFSIICDAVSLCAKLSARKNEKLHHLLLSGSCNTLVGLVISQYLIRSKPAGKLSRFEIITKAFKAILERNFATAKRPREYAQRLNVSTAYLNECIKNATGHSISHHIQQRIILEAKRLLYHSDKSIKEIATELGYDDYPYFSRLFTKVTGITPMTFRNKNHD
ncbi:helix-turn-helix domain-containing protein [Chryseosolibacter indicus]|uniref:AraC family transcriptional regulator n=1 Tax=Chryseosolibacter indicus TaxID=2782351 RepID=A0ABS5VUD4_9BACT|nr:helix-turn-helix domain-containing protein [Chryseosolibacter indicus]MBT1705032.1 AraC family transcriptional regulator [Chryseosolibacter indicus]